MRKTLADAGGRPIGGVTLPAFRTGVGGVIRSYYHPTAGKLISGRRGIVAVPDTGRRCLAFRVQAKVGFVTIRAPGRDSQRIGRAGVVSVAARLVRIGELAQEQAGGNGRFFTQDNSVGPVRGMTDNTTPSIISKRSISRVVVNDYVPGLIDPQPVAVFIHPDPFSGDYACLPVAVLTSGGGIVRRRPQKPVLTAGQMNGVTALALVAGSGIAAMRGGTRRFAVGIISGGKSLACPKNEYDNC